MPPAGGGQHGCTKQDHPAAAGLRRDGDTLPRPTPPSPAIAPIVYQRRKKQRQLKKQQDVASIPEGPLMEILLRVPYRSLCRFTCVSRSWLAICSDPDVRKRSPQSLSGFFHKHRHGNDLKFYNLSGRGPPLVDPSLPFILRVYERFMIEQCSRSLLLCKCWKPCAEKHKFDLVVCNPTTEMWTVLPPIEFLDEEDGDLVCFRPVDAYLGSNAASPTCFVVFVPLVGRLDDVAIYLSETGQWTRSGWYDEAVPVVTAECVFLKGFMHLMIDEPFIVAVDTKGEEWRRIPLPGDMEPSYGNTSMGRSQGLLHAWYIDPDEDYQLSVWVLEDYDGDKWTLKHTVDVLGLFDTECQG
ncbi:hypothetical protein ACQ4PT_046604 [Festuca glaucescens]